MESGVYSRRAQVHVMAYAAQNREFGEKWRTRVIELPQARLTKLLQRGMAEKKLDRMKEVTDKLTEDGVRLFSEAFDKLLKAIEKNT